MKGSNQIRRCRTSSCGSWNPMTSRRRTPQAARRAPARPDATTKERSMTAARAAAARTRARELAEDRPRVSLVPWNAMVLS